MTQFLSKGRCHDHKILYWGEIKSRISYDNLSWCQWVSGFAMIAREEHTVDTKNAILDHLSEIMEDTNDFSWQSANQHMLSCYVGWRRERLNGLRLPKLIGLGVLMRKDSVLKIAALIANQNLKQRQLFVVSIRGPCVNIRKTMKLGELFINRYVPPALQWVKNTSIWLRIVAFQ